MDITPIFRPPTPPKAGFFFFITLFFAFTSLAKEATVPENTNAPFLVFYQPLYEHSHADSKNYVKKVRKLFADHSVKEVERLLVAKPNQENCLKKKLDTCSQALYFHSLCIPKKQQPSQYCQRNTRVVSANYFKEPVFNRLQWNKFAVIVNYFCNKKPAKVCNELSKLHDEFMKSYYKIMAQRRQSKKEQSKITSPKNVRRKSQ